MKNWAQSYLCKANFYLYLFSTFLTTCAVIIWGKYPRVLTFYGDTIPCALTIHRDTTTVYFCPMGGLSPWLKFYIWSDICTATVTAVICEAPVILSKTSSSRSSCESWVPSSPNTLLWLIYGGFYCCYHGFSIWYVACIVTTHVFVLYNIGVFHGSSHIILSS